VKAMTSSKMGTSPKTNYKFERSLKHLGFTQRVKIESYRNGLEPRPYTKKGSDEAERLERGFGMLQDDQ
jgi:hypothetical protein